MNIVENLKNDKGYAEIKRQWFELFNRNPPPYNYDEYGGIEDYKSKLKECIKNKTKS